MLTTTTLTIIGLAIWLLGYLFIGGYLQKVYLKYKQQTRAGSRVS